MFNKIYRIEHNVMQNQIIKLIWYQFYIIKIKYIFAIYKLVAVVNKSLSLFVL